MAIKKRDTNCKLEIDLDGPEGNVFCLMKIAKDFCRQLGWDHEPIIKDMMSSDYEHAIKVFDGKFGDMCDLIRS